MHNPLHHRLQPVVRRIRFCRLMMTLATIWFCLALVVGLLIFLNQRGQLDVTNWWLPMSLIAATATFFGAMIVNHSAKDFNTVVHGLEKHFPDLDSTLLTAIEQNDQLCRPLGFLQQDVTRRAVNHSFANSWGSLVPAWQLMAAPLLGLLSLFALSAAIVMMAWYALPIHIDPSLQFADVVVENAKFEISIEPGNTEVERGKSLMVLARFKQAIPPESVLVFAGSDGEQTRLPMNKSLDDPVFGARIASVSAPVKYWVEFADRQSDQYDISVFEYPELVRTDATLHFPEYTKLEDKTVQDVRRVSAVEGTDAEFSFFINKEVASALLVPTGKPDDKTGSGEPAVASETIALQPDPTDPRKVTARIKMLESTKFELKLVDAEGRANRIPPKLILNVIENQVPDLKLTSPRRDVQVSAIEELELAATAWDDFGINSLGVNFSISGKAPNDLVLLKDGAAKQRLAIDHMLEFESLDAQPDELLSYYFWVEDLGPDGEPRRVESDMYFAEVRHFDEIFRQGQAPSAGQQSEQQQGQSGQNAQQAQQLAELQKEIINATWKIIRRENNATVSREFADDSQLVSESQADALTQLEELAAEVEDATSRSFVEAASTHMNEAIIHLTDAKTSNGAEALKPALASEQAAYQAMLKLRAREHEVVRAQQQQQGQQGQQAGNRAQQQMEQLNLKDDENRYESERTAADPQQSAEQREDRQVLSRLRELSRRQEDLNDRIKELQSALEKAETKEDKEEIERRLKSLRDQQEQMLRDTDELLDRMQQAENQQRMSEESQQLEQTRENLREASEALEKGQVSRAAAEGTRAQRDLQELRDEFQDRTAGQFTEQMRELRNEAQDLEQKEQDVGKALADANNQQLSTNDATKETPSLRSEANAPDVAEQMKEQQTAVDNLRQRMRETIEEAETFEPLLAEQLYDTYRKSELSRPDRALESARESFERGWADDAQTEELKARDGITEIREGVEQAAESVLGNETDALRVAQNTLRELDDQLQEEMNRAQGQPGGKAGENTGKSTVANDQLKPDENQNGQSDQSQRQRDEQNQETQNQQSGGQGTPAENPIETESKPGDQQPGDQQPGQPRDQQSEQPQDGQGAGASRNPGDQQPQGNGNPDDQQNQPQDGQPQDGQQPDVQRAGQGGANPQDGQQNRRGGFDFRSGGGNLRTMEPLAGDDFRQWSDRLRDVEEMMADPELRSEAARIRDEAKQIRREAQRHSAEPNWDLVKLNIVKPLAELQDRVAEELLRRTSSDARVPLDRDPVPTQYQDAVRRYYERIGSGQ